MAKLLAVFNALLWLVYPVAVYFGLTRYGARGVGLLLLVLLVPSVAARLKNARREDVLVVLRIPFIIAVLAGLSAWLDNPLFVLAMPVLVNLALLATFVGSLRSTPMVERFARMQEDSLSEAQVQYCRSVTKVWSVFFAVNAAVSAALALWAPLSWWAAYTGLLAYVAIGTLAGVEYTVRKARFREYGTGLHDRLLARVFPPHPEGNGL